MSDSTEEVRAHTVRLELVDRPGELLRALEPIADHGGNLLSVFHERGNVTPRGQIPVEVDLEATPERFAAIVEALRDSGINVTEAGPDRDGERLTVVLSGQLIETELSDTLSRIREATGASVTDLSLSAPPGAEDVSSARLRLTTGKDTAEATLAAVRSIAQEKGLHLVEPLAPEGEA